MLENLKPEYVTPLVAWLAHEECTENGGLFEVGGGYFGKLRWERTEGKLFKLGREITPEAVRGAWDDVTDWKKTTHPANITESLVHGDAATSPPSRKGGNEFIDVDQALGYELPELESSYDERDLALYALGVGAGKIPGRREGPAPRLRAQRRRLLRPAHLRRGARAQRDLQDGVRGADRRPASTTGSIASSTASSTSRSPGPLPAHARLKHKARISEILDKGKHAVVVTHLDSYDADTGELLVKNDVSMVVRGAGGWGGDRGPATDRTRRPSAPPTRWSTEKTGENQALLYRLSGDWNPLHVDPEFATMFGFEKPILHGLCTFGFAGRAVVNAFAKGDPRTFKSIKVRFADSVFPGETLKIEMWKENDLKILHARHGGGAEQGRLEQRRGGVLPGDPQAEGEGRGGSAGGCCAAAPAFGTPQSFEGIGAYVAAHPELTKQVGVVYQFKIKSPDSQWVVDLKAGAVKAGLADKAECTLELTDADWLDMVTGKADPMKLFQGGKLKITGNVMASQKLDFLKKIDRGALPRGPGGGGARSGGSGGGSGHHRGDDLRRHRRVHRQDA